MFYGAGRILARSLRHCHACMIGNLQRETPICPTSESKAGQAPVHSLTVLPGARCTLGYKVTSKTG